MKQFFKRILLVPLIGIFVLFTNISANKSNWSGMGLSRDEINNSERFQLQRGGNCLAELEKLHTVLDRFISQKIDATYLNNFLGKPNKIVTKNNQVQYCYYLTEKMDSHSLNLIVKDYNLVSYTIENSNNN